MNIMWYILFYSFFFVMVGIAFLECGIGRVINLKE